VQKKELGVVGSAHSHVDVQLIFVEQCGITESFLSGLRASCGVSCSITHSVQIMHDQSRFCMTDAQVS